MSEFKVGDEAYLNHQGWHPEDPDGLPAGCCRVKIVGIGQRGEAICEYISGARFAGTQYVVSKQAQAEALHRIEYCAGCEGNGMHSCEGSHAAREQAAHAKMAYSGSATFALIPKAFEPKPGSSEDAKRDRILPALRKIIAEWSPAAAFDVVQRAMSENEITDAEARELLGMSPAVPATMPMVPKPLEGEFAVKEADPATVRLLADLDIERRRASKLADECGHLQARLDASEGNVVTANAKVADLESDLRVAAKRIKWLEGQISLLRRACR